MLGFASLPLADSPGLVELGLLFAFGSLALACLPGALWLARRNAVKGRLAEAAALPS